MRTRLTHQAERQMERRFDAQREAEVLIDLIAAEFRSDPMSVQCFDLGLVERVKACADAFQGQPERLRVSAHAPSSSTLYRRLIMCSDFVAQHTPGPWWIDEKELGLDLRGHVPISAKKHGALAQVVWKMENDVLTPACQANARLIAAAPDLLAALRDLVDAMTGRMDGETVALHNALAALARASCTPSGVQPVENPPV